MVFRKAAKSRGITLKLVSIDDYDSIVIEGMDRYGVKKSRGIVFLSESLLVSSSHSDDQLSPIIARYRNKSKPTLSPGMALAMEHFQKEAIVAIAMETKDDTFFVGSADFKLKAFLIHGTFTLATDGDAEAFEIETVSGIRKSANEISRDYGNLPIIKSMKSAIVDRSLNVVNVEMSVPVEDIISTLPLIAKPPSAKP